MVHWEKQNIMLYALNFKKGVVHISVRVYEFSLLQIFRKSLELAVKYNKNECHLWYG